MRLRPVIGWTVFVFIIALTGRIMIARGFVQLGALLVTMNKYDAAKETFSRAMFIRNDSCASCGMGLVYRLQNKNDEAEKWLRKSIDLDADDYCAYHQLGLMYYDAEDYPKAIEAFNQELKLHSNATLYHFLGNSYYLSGNVEQSIEYYETSARLDPKYGNVLVDLGNAYGRLNRYQEAKKTLSQAVKLRPRDVRARSMLGTTLFILGDKEGAMEQYLKVRELDPSLAGEMLDGFDELAESVKAKESKESSEPNMHGRSIRNKTRSNH